MLCLSLMVHCHLSANYFPLVLFFSNVGWLSNLLGWWSYVLRKCASPHSGLWFMVAPGVVVVMGCVKHDYPFLTIHPPVYLSNSSLCIKFSLWVLNYKQLLTRWCSFSNLLLSRTTWSFNPLIYCHILFYIIELLVTALVLDILAS